MRLRSPFVLALSIAALVPSGARATPITQDACPGTATVSVFKALGNDVLENLLFANEAIWISDSTSGQVRSFSADGASGKSVAIASPGGLVLGIDGKIYAGQGDSIQHALARDHQASVVSFDPHLASPAVTTYASGFNMVNGLIGAPNGDLYLSNDLDTGLTRVPRTDPAHPVTLNDTWGTNGLVFAGTQLYSAITFDQRSPIEVTDLASPTFAHHTAYQLTFGAVSLQPAVYTNGDPSRPLVGLKGLDDMTSDGTYLYPVANGMGELLRVDIATGASCLIASGMPNASSVRIAPEGTHADPGFSDGDPATIDFYVTGFTGNIQHVVFKP